MFWKSDAVGVSLLNRIEAEQLFVVCDAASSREYRTSEQCIF